MFLALAIGCIGAGGSPKGDPSADTGEIDSADSGASGAHDTGAEDTGPEDTGPGDAPDPDLVATLTLPTGDTGYAPSPTAVPLDGPAPGTFAVGNFGWEDEVFANAAYASATWCAGGVYLLSAAAGDDQHISEQAIAWMEQDDNCLGASIGGGFDFDGDGVADLVAGAPFDQPWGGDNMDLLGIGKAVVYSGAFLATARGEIPSTVGRSFLGADPYYSEAGWGVAGVPDLDGDGLDEVIVGTLVSDGGAGAWIVPGGAGGEGTSLLLDDVALATFDSDATWAGVVGDVDGDGLAEVAVRDHGMKVFSGADAAGTLGADAALLTISASSPDYLPQVIPVGDFDGDGTPDVFLDSIVSCSRLLASGARTVMLDSSNSVPLYDPDGNRMLHNVAVGDYDGDAAPDLSAAGDRLYLFHLADLPHTGTADAELAFRSYAIADSALCQYCSAATIDWNQDGIDDLLSFSTIWGSQQVGSVFAGR